MPFRAAKQPRVLAAKEGRLVEGTFVPLSELYRPREAPNAGLSAWLFGERGYGVGRDLVSTREILTYTSQ